MIRMTATAEEAQHLTLREPVTIRRNDYAALLPFARLCNMAVPVTEPENCVLSARPAVGLGLELLDINTLDCWFVQVSHIEWHSAIRQRRTVYPGYWEVHTFLKGRRWYRLEKVLVEPIRDR